QFEDFALHVHGDLAREVAARHRGSHFGDVAHLSGEVAGHEVDGVGEVLPGAGHAGYLRLPAEPSFGTDFTRHARHLAGEGVELVHHGVDSLLEQENFAVNVHGNLLREVATGDGGGHLGDVTHLRREVPRHSVDRVGEVLPGAAHAGHLRLAAQFALGAHLT